MGAGLHRCGNLGWSLAAFATVVTACFGGAAPVVPREAAASQLSPLDVVVVGGAPCGIAASSGSLWVSDLEGDRVVRIDPQTR
ncbi:MAG TPA: hypothetical protein VHI71_10105, partial [Actinomycetota bacterium]|nr:hypothetical protein [Actinomycetota bacterium]